MSAERATPNWKVWTLVNGAGVIAVLPILVTAISLERYRLAVFLVVLVALSAAASLACLRRWRTQSGPADTQFARWVDTHPLITWIVIGAGIALSIALNMAVGTFSGN